VIKVLMIGGKANVVRILHMRNLCKFMQIFNGQLFSLTIVLGIILRIVVCR
jgi:hypothetical protein